MNKFPTVVFVGDIPIILNNVTTVSELGNSFAIWFTSGNFLRVSFEEGKRFLEILRGIEDQQPYFNVVDDEI